MLDSKIKAADFSPNLAWINVKEPLTLATLSGKIVLLDFWTFCCSDCMQILPYLAKLEEEYKEHLVVIGVHSAKFDNENDEANVRLAVAKYGIENPVVLDRAFALWEKYFVREWPTLILIDPDGMIVERIPCSQGPYGKFETLIDSLISEFGANGKLKPGRLSQILVSAETSPSQLRFPGKIICSEDGETIYIADSGHNRVLACKANGEQLFCIGSGKQGAEDGDFGSAALNSPQGMVLAGEYLYIADTYNNLIRRADLNTHNLQTIAGNGKQRLYEKDEAAAGSLFKALDTSISTPWDLALAGNCLFIAMAGCHQIWCYHLESGEIEIYAGTGRESLVDGDRLKSQLSQPSSLSLSGSKLYFADSETSSIRYLDLDSGIVKTLLGEGLFCFGDIDGDVSGARLQHPLALAVYKQELIIADSYNHKIKSLDLEKMEVKTIAGTGKAGKGWKQGELQFSEPGGICLKADSLYIADSNNHAIKILDLKSGEAQQLEIKNTTNSVPQLPNLSHLGARNCKIKARSKLKCKLNFRLAKNFHLNQEMPATIYLHQDKSILMLGHGDCLELRNGESDFLLSASHTVTETTLGKASIYLLVYYCGERASSACFVKSFAMDLLLSGSAEANELVEIDLPLELG